MWREEGARHANCILYLNLNIWSIPFFRMTNTDFYILIINDIKRRVKLYFNNIILVAGTQHSD